MCAYGESVVKTMLAWLSEGQAEPIKLCVTFMEQLCPKVAFSEEKKTTS